MKLIHSLVILTVSLLAGCTQPQAPLSRIAPHGGMLIGLPDTTGSVEVARQAVADKVGITRLYLYGLDADMKPMTPMPTAASLKSRGRGGKSFDFKPSSDTDPSKVGSLESPDLPDQGDIVGELSVTINGKPVTLPISIR
jgi:hypothetical protein